MSPRGREGDPVGRWLRDLARAASWHRRLLAAGLLAGAMALALHALAPPPPPSVLAVTAARDLAAGSRVQPGDLAVSRVPPGLVPDGALRSPGSARGATLVSAVRRGELLTDARLLGPSSLDRLGAGLVAAPVRIADAEAVRLLRPGSVVDVLAAGGAVPSTVEASEDAATGAASAAPARLVAAAVRVLTVPRDDAGFGGSVGEGALVLVATTSVTAERLAGAAVTERLSVVVRR